MRNNFALTYRYSWRTSAQGVQHTLTAVKGGSWQSSDVNRWPQQSTTKKTKSSPEAIEEFPDIKILDENKNNEK